MYFTSKSSVKDGSFSGGSTAKDFSSKDKISDKDLICYEKELREDENYYVQCPRDRPHEYSYPLVSSYPHKKLSPTELSNSLSLRTLSSEPKKSIQLDPLSLQPPPLLPTKSTGSTKKKR